MDECMCGKPPYLLHNLVRETSYSYDAARRLTAADFDGDTVAYAYDAAGNRTTLTLPGDLEVVYHYDARGRLVRLADWDGQASDFFYDGAARAHAPQHR